MDTIDRWGRYTLIRQVCFGGLAYSMSAAYRGIDAYTLAFALVAAGIVAIVITMIAMAGQNTIAIAVTLSSLTTMLAGFCIIGSSVVFTLIFSFIAFSCAILAVMLARQEGSMGGEPFFLVFLYALPVIGPSWSILGKKMRGGKA